MTSQWVERTWIRTGGYGRFRGEWVKTVSKFFTSTDVKFDIKTMRVGNKILRTAGFLCAIIELAPAFFSHKVEALADFFLSAYKQALRIPGSYPSGFIDVSLQHLALDGYLARSVTLICSCCFADQTKKYDHEKKARNSGLFMHLCKTRIPG